MHNPKQSEKRDETRELLDRDASTPLTAAIAAFHDRETAERAVRDLEEHGFDHKQIGLATRVVDKTKDQHTDVVGRDHAKGAAGGLGAGAVLGGIVGAAVSITIPAIGIVVAAGALAGLLTGAVAGGLLGALTGLGIPRHDAEYYESQFHAGKSLVTVASEGRTAEAREILRRNGGVEREGASAPATDTEVVGRPAVEEPVTARHTVEEPVTARRSDEEGRIEDR